MKTTIVIEHGEDLVPEVDIKNGYIAAFFPCDLGNQITELQQHVTELEKRLRLAQIASAIDSSMMF